MPPEQDDPSLSGSADDNKPSPEAAMGNMVNAAVKQHVARFIKNEFPALIGEALKPILEQVAAVKTVVPSTEEVESKKGKGKQDPEYLALQKQFDDMRNSLAASEKARVDAENKSREDRAYSEVRAGLEGKVRPELLDIVAKNLFYVDKRVVFDESGTPLFRGQRAPYIGGEPEDVQLPLRSGLDEFMKSEAAKPFLPAPVSSGASPLPKRASQTVVPQTVTTGVSDADKAARAQDRAARARANGAQ